MKLDNSDQVSLRLRTFLHQSPSSENRIIFVNHELFFFRFMLSDANIPIMEKAAQDPDRKVTFVDLVPGRLYNITLWTVSGGVTSKPLERQDR